MAMNYKEVSRGLPKEEAERYSTGTKLVDNFVDSLQKQGLLPKRFAQVQRVTATKQEVYSEVITLETFLEGKRRETFLIGGKSAEQLEKELNEAGAKVSSNTGDMIHSKDFTTLETPQSIDLVWVSVQDFGLPTGGTTREIFTRADATGFLERCPAEVGPHQRLVDKDQPMNTGYLIAMDTIADRYGDPSVFELVRRESGMWLRDGWAGPDDRWYPGIGFVFSLRKDTPKP